jgi:patatin-like phospholipase/acyl hydrolase
MKIEKTFLGYIIDGYLFKNKPTKKQIEKIKNENENHLKLNLKKKELYDKLKKKR